MKRELIKDFLDQLNRNNSHGDSSPEIEVEAVHIELILVFPRDVVSSLINDNYSGFPTSLNFSSQGLDLIVREMAQEQTVMFQNCKQDVSCINVVNFAPIVTIHGQPQRKGLSPGHGLNRLKLVKGVSCVNQCLFAPSVPNVPRVVTEISVGGKASELLPSLAKVGFKSQSNVSFKRRLQSSFQGKAITQLLSPDCEQICKSPQEQGPLGSYSLSNIKASRRKGFLQPSFSGSEAQQKMAKVKQ